MVISCASYMYSVHQPLCLTTGRAKDDVDSLNEADDTAVDKSVDALDGVSVVDDVDKIVCLPISTVAVVLIDDERRVSLLEEVDDWATDETVNPAEEVAACSVEDFVFGLSLCSRCKIKDNGILRRHCTMARDFSFDLCWGLS